MTFTGRTDIWREVLRVPINPIIGAGYCNFWQPERGESVSRALGFFFTIKEAHDGYLEVYLNSGLIGLGFIGVLLLGTARRIINGLETSDSFEIFRLAVLVGAMLYNITESALCGLVLLWVILLLVLIKLPSHLSSDINWEAESVN